MVCSFIISGLLTTIGKTSLEALTYKEPTKFVAKIAVFKAMISGR
jgi:hypothetical protein